MVIEVYKYTIIRKKFVMYDNEVFGRISSQYDKHRLNYPDELFEEIISLKGLPKKAHVLDVGCGTGKSTEKFAQNKYKIIALDISNKQIAIARKHLSNYSNVKCIVGEFGKVELPKSYFDLVISGQAFHWINPVNGVPEIRRVLKNTGYLALFWYRYVPKESVVLQKIKKLNSVYGRPDYGRTGSIKHGINDTIKNCSMLKLEKKRLYRRSVRFSKSELIEYIKTLSWVQLLYENNEEKFRSYIDGVKTILFQETNPLKIPFIFDLIIFRNRPVRLYTQIKYKVYDILSGMQNNFRNQNKNK